MQLIDYITRLKPCFNHVIYKVHRVELEDGAIILPESAEGKLPFLEVIAVGEGTCEGEPCPVEVGDYVMSLPGSIQPLDKDYMTGQWIHILGKFPKEWAEKQINQRIKKPSTKDLVTLVN